MTATCIETDVKVNVAKFFEENGYIAPLDVLNMEEVAELKQNFKNLEEKIGKKDAQYSLHNVHLRFPWVLNVASHENVLSPLQKILGPNLIILDSRFICKYPETEVSRDDGKKSFVAWHQDSRYWGIDGDVVSVWLAVDDADLANGCMCVIPGTQKMGLVTHNTAESAGNLLTSNQEIPSDIFDASKSTPCPVKSGQMSLHHGHTIHGSEPNLSDRRRCGFVIRYVAPTVKPVDDPDRPRKFACTVLVSGQDEHKHFNDNSPAWFQRKSMPAA